MCAVLQGNGRNKSKLLKDWSSFCINRFNKPQRVQRSSRLTTLKAITESLFLHGVPTSATADSTANRKRKRVSIAKELHLKLTIESLQSFVAWYSTTSDCVVAVTRLPSATLQVVSIFKLKTCMTVIACRWWNFTCCWSRSVAETRSQVSCVADRKFCNQVEKKEGNQRLFVLLLPQKKKQQKSVHYWKAERIVCVDTQPVKITSIFEMGSRKVLEYVVNIWRFDCASPL